MSISGVYGFSELTNIEGTLVPLASINRVPSKIPFVGGLFKGDNEVYRSIGETTEDLIYEALKASI